MLLFKHLDKVFLRHCLQTRYVLAHCQHLRELGILHNMFLSLHCIKYFGCTDVREARIKLDSGLKRTRLEANLEFLGYWRYF